MLLENIFLRSQSALSRDRKRKFAVESTPVYEDPFRISFPSPRNFLQIPSSEVLVLVLYLNIVMLAIFSSTLVIQRAGAYCRANEHSDPLIPS